MSIAVRIEIVFFSVSCSNGIPASTLVCRPSCKSSVLPKSRPATRYRSSRREAESAGPLPIATDAGHTGRSGADQEGDGSSSSKMDPIFNPANLQPLGEITT